MRIYIASDHAAFEAKDQLIKFLSPKYDMIDLGTTSADSTDYPIWSEKLVRAVHQDSTYGILLCGSGIGVSMVANRYQGMRAALCRDEDDAQMARRHNDANVLCLSGRKTPIQLMNKISEVFLTTSFEGERHQRRINLFNNLGEPLS